MDTAKNYWLSIAPYVYYNSQSEQLILYNTQSGATMESDSDAILALMESLHEKKNLGVIYMEGKKLKEEPYNSFILEFLQKSMGKLIDVEEISKKPIQLMPILNLQRDVEKLQKDRERAVGEDVLHYLIELNIYVNQQCEQQCPNCASYFRQNLCCTKSESSTPLSINSLHAILEQVKHAPIGKLNILGGDILKYPYMHELSELLSGFKDHVHFWIQYANLASHKEQIPDVQYDIPVAFPVDEPALADCVEKLKTNKTHYHFFITGEDEYNKVELLIEKFAIKSTSTHPVYTKNNLPFFENFVYLNQEDIFSEVLSQRQIFARQKLNTNFFGSLTIFANGDVHANTNSIALGNMHKDTLLDLICKEMYENTAWRKIRDKTPCNECLYQYLCPSPSNYEMVIGQPSLCHIIK